MVRSNTIKTMCLTLELLRENENKDALCSCVCPIWRTLFRFNISISYYYEWNKRIRVL